MKYMLVKLAADNGCGFGNQMYSVSNALDYAIKNKYNFIFLTQFLNQIYTNSYSNASDILDFEMTNTFLQKYNIQIADFLNFKFNIVDIVYGYNNYLINILDEFKTSLINDKLYISKEFSFSEIAKKFINLYQNKFGLPLKKELCKLTIQYKLDNRYNSCIYDLIDDHLLDNIIIDFSNIVPYRFSVFCDNLIYYDIRTNLAYNKKFKEAATLFLKDNIQTNQKINCIHLKLEDDAINHYSIENKQSKNECKHILEQKYISKIINSINKTDLTIILSGDYNNNVMKFLKDNHYNFITTPIWTNFRDLSAIYDLHIADYCNNKYIGVFESSFSYMILFRIKSHISQFIQVYFSKEPIVAQL